MNKAELNKQSLLALKSGKSVYKLIALNEENIGQFAVVINNQLIVCSGDDKNLFQKAKETFDFSSAPGILNLDKSQIFIDKIAGKPQLIICGAGHVSLYVAKIAAMMDFSVTVIDDRSEFANAERFPFADEIICKSFSEALQQISYGDNSYFVIVTRGHTNDEQCLKQILNNQFAYVGMIGSRRKTKLVMDDLLNEGFSQEILSQVFSPIGIDIGAHTPNEIGLCIMAQVIAQKNKKSPSDYLGDDVINTMINESSYVEATIINHTGSTPRGMGAKLIVLHDGSFVGTVGGGESEMRVIEAARKMIDTRDSRIVEFNMNNSDAKKCGMVCGGKIKLILTSIIS